MIIIALATIYCIMEHVTNKSAKAVKALNYFDR